MMDHELLEQLKILNDTLEDINLNLQNIANVLNDGITVYNNKVIGP